MQIKPIEAAAKIHEGKPSIIITGVTGQDGSHMVDYLLKNTDMVIYGAARRLSVPNHKNLEHINDPRFVLFNMDVTDPHSIGQSIIAFKPDYFINLAAQSFVGSSWDFPVQTWETNCTAILHMLEAIRQYHPTCRFYNAGSSEEMGDVLFSPQDETHPPRPRSPYGASKVAARQLVKVYRESYHLYAVQGWLYNHEGTRRGEEFVTRKISKGVARIKKDFDYVNKAGASWEPTTPIFLGNLDSRRDWGDAEDFVDAIWRMMNQEKYNKGMHFSSANPSTELLSKVVKDYVVGTSEEHSIREFVEESFRAAGIQGSWQGTGENEKFVTTGGVVVVAVDPKFYRPADVNKLVANYSLIENELGWKPTTTFKSLIKKMIDNDTKA